MIATTQSPQLCMPLGLKHPIKHRRFLCQNFFQRFFKRLTRFPPNIFFFALCKTHGHSRKYFIHQATKITFIKHVFCEIGARSEHPAADIHADRGRNHGALSRNDAPNRRTHPGVHVRHRRHVMENEGKSCHIFELRNGGFVNIVCPHFDGNQQIRLKSLFDRHGYFLFLISFQYDMISLPASIQDALSTSLIDVLSVMLLPQSTKRERNA